MTGKKLLITGAPGVGKTTLFKRLSEALASFRPVGFYTAEIREDGVRKGFELVSLDGRNRILSHVNIRSPSKVGKYGVDIAGFENFLDEIGLLDTTANLVMIDEIGKMECLSDKFGNLLMGILDSEKSLVATIGLRGGGIIADIKRRRDVTLFEVTQRNRDSLLSRILAHLRNE